MISSPARDRALETFAAAFGAAPEVIARAPGRVNLIGEHTDYNDGFVLAMALPFDTVIAARARSDGRVSITSEGYGAAEFDLGSDPADTTLWARYVHGMEWALGGEGIELVGWEGTIATDIPTGASLSSSAALEMAAGLALLELAGSSMRASDLAGLGQTVENEVIGVPSGIMDQLVSAASTADHAALIDCRSLTVTPCPLPTDVAVVVMDTGTRRELVESEYGDRRASCERVAQALGVAALRDAQLDDLSRLPAEMAADAVGARHVITENERTLDASDAMRRDDAGGLGSLMSKSHVSLRDDYDVSGPALDRMVSLARATQGCLGARMTGGGFAGCAVALVEADATDAFVRSVIDRYDAESTETARLWACSAGAGASVERLAG